MNPKFTIKNFKVFDEEGATFELAPVTILTGCNSSGKSSIVKAIMLFSDVMNDIKNDIVNWNRCELPEYKLDFSKLRYNLGKYDLVLNKKAEKNAKISFEYTFGSRVLVEDVSLKLSFVSSDSDEMNYGWLSDMEIFKMDGTCIFAAKIVDGGIKIKTINVRCIRRNFINYTKMKCAFLAEPKNFYGDKYGNDIRKNVENDNSINECERSVLFNYFDKINKSVLYNYIDDLRTIGEKYNVTNAWNLACRLSNCGLFYNPSIFDELDELGIAHDKSKTIDFLAEKAQKALEYFHESLIHKVVFNKFIDGYKNSNSITLAEYLTTCEESRLSLFLKEHDPVIDLFNIPMISYTYYFWDNQLRNVPKEYPKLEDAEEILKDLKSHREKWNMNTCRELRAEEIYEELIFNYSESYYKHIKRDVCIDASSVLSILSSGNDKECMFSSYIYVYLFFVDFIKDIFTSYANTDYVSSSRAVVQRLYNIGDKSNEFGILIQRYMDAKKNCKKNYKPDTFLNKWFRNFGIGNSIVFRSTEEGLGTLAYLCKGNDDFERHLLADEGYGLTQLVSILLQIETSIMEAKTNRTNIFKSFSTFDGSEEKLEPTVIAVEEPEIHLHPRYQSMLANIFVDAYKTYNVRFVIETHSEYLIRKLQTIVASNLKNNEKGVSANDVSINYLYSPNPDERPKNEKQVKRINIKDDGCLKEPFGSGFFDEADNLSMDLLTIKAGK